MPIQMICKKPGCQTTACTGKHYCIKHIALEVDYKKRQTPKRKKSNAWHHLYNSGRWRTISREFLFNNPDCCRCGAPAKIADHIQPHRGNLELFYDPDNLQPLCWRCHSAKTLKENNFFKDDETGMGGEKLN